MELYFWRELYIRSISVTDILTPLYGLTLTVSLCPLACQSATLSLRVHNGMHLVDKEPFMFDTQITN